MSYILVSADFPKITSEERQKIYQCLEKEKWRKITDPGRDISTVWEASFVDTASEDACIKTAVNDFTNCSKPYTTPKLVLQFGPSKPTRSGF